MLLGGRPGRPDRPERGEGITKRACAGRSRPARRVSAGSACPPGTGGRGLRGVDGPRREIDLRQVLEHASRLDGVCRIVRPDERAVVRHERGPDFARREAQRSERLHNHKAGVAFVVGDDLGLRHRAGHRHVAAEIVGVRRVETPDRHLRLRECRGELRMRVHDASAAERTVELQMRRRIRRGAECTVDHPARLDRYEHHVHRRQLLIRDAARLDGEEPRFVVRARHVAERLDHQAGARQGHVRPKYPLTERMRTHSLVPPCPQIALTRSLMASSRFIAVLSSAVEPGTPPNASCSSR